MKKTKIILSLIIVMTLAFTGIVYGDDFGAEGASADTFWTLEEMLEYAIEDEYMAKAEYEALIEEFGAVRPFTNIIKAEQRHIEMLLPLFEKYDIQVPVDDAEERIVIPETLEETFSIGVEAEIKNIDMYKNFLEEDLEEDIATIFEKLMKASEKHLKAFERNEDVSSVDQRGNRNNGRRGNRNR